MFRKGKLIVFLGPVGVGKSTIIKYLIQRLKIQKVKVYYEFIKYFHGPSYILWAFVAFIILGIKQKKRAYSPWLILNKSGYIDLAKKLTFLSMSLDTFFSIPLKLIKITILKNLGYYVFCEEYLYSTIIDYKGGIVGYKINNKLAKFIISTLGVLLSKYKPDIVIILTANISELMKRWAIRGYGEPQLSYVKNQYTFINAFINKLHELNTYYIVIDTTNLSIDETVDKVLSSIFIDRDT
jgi:thymidylate kinase